MILIYRPSDILKLEKKYFDDPWARMDKSYELCYTYLLLVISLCFYATFSSWEKDLFKRMCKKDGMDCQICWKTYRFVYVGVDFSAYNESEEYPIWKFCSIIDRSFRYVRAVKS